MTLPSPVAHQQTAASTAAECGRGISGGWWRRWRTWASDGRTVVPPVFRAGQLHRHDGQISQSAGANENGDVWSLPSALVITSISTYSRPSAGPYSSQHLLQTQLATGSRGWREQSIRNVSYWFFCSKISMLLDRMHEKTSDYTRRYKKI